MRTSKLGVDPPGELKRRKEAVLEDIRGENEFGDKNIWRQVYNGTENFFDDWNHQYQLEIIAAYHNEKKAYD